MKMVPFLILEIGGLEGGEKKTLKNE